MAIYQISQLTNRKGLQIDLPQLAGAELGWSIDERRLWIGNGTLAEGAPVVGNTEVLTEFSDLFGVLKSYTYKGVAAGYVAQTGPTPGQPVQISLQNWMDQWASVKDFGAKGDGITDDTAAINRALNQLYCVAGNPQVRRALFFPAGVYLVSDSINIPPYARLYGEGVQSSVIQLGPASTATVVARTADSLQQTGPNIGIGGAIPPQQISIALMGFQSLSSTADAFQIECTRSISFSQVSFSGPLTQLDLQSSAYNTAAVRLTSTAAFPISDFSLVDCETTGTTYAVATTAGSGYWISGGVLDSCEFSTHYRGVVLGTDAAVPNLGPTGIRTINSIFDLIYAEGVLFGACQTNATGYNIFYDVGNHFSGTALPYTAIIDIQSDNNVSIGDLFQRTDQFATDANPGTSFPRITTNNTVSIAFTGSSQIALGNYVRTSGYQASLSASATSAPIINGQGMQVTVNATANPAFKVDYTIVRGLLHRTGTMTVATGAGANPLVWNDDFVENGATGILLTPVQPGGSPSMVLLEYTSTAGVAATFTYSITHLA